MNKGILILFLAMGLRLFGADSLMFQHEQELNSLLKELRSARSNEVKSQTNKKFKQYLFETLQNDESFHYPFDQLKTLGSIKSPDDKVRIFNWNVEQDDGTQKYFCYIMKFDDRRKKYKVIELIDNSMMLPPRPTEVLTAENWYGALYYKIIPVKKRNKTYYTVLGWDGNNSMSNIKLIDVLSFSGNTARLGSPIFKVGDQTLKRVFFEHSEKAYMSLKYEEQYERIIFDHLSPESPGMEGYYAYYIPDMSYDAFKFENNKWVLHEDVIGINKNTREKIVVMIPSTKKGGIEERVIKNKWIDPSGDKSPNGGNAHIAVLPDTDNSKGKSVKTKKESLKESNKAGSYSMNPYLNKKRRRR